MLAPTPAPVWRRLRPSALLIPLRHCRSLKLLKAAHALLTASGLLAASLDPSRTLSRLLYAFSRVEPIPPPSSAEYALSLFRQIPRPSTFPHNVLMRALTLLAAPLASLRVFRAMRRRDVPPDLHTLPFALKACARLGCLRLGRALHAQSLKLGFGGGEFAFNALISVYASSGAMVDAQRLFDGAPRRDVVSYNALLDGYVKAGETDHARGIFEGMPQRDVVSYGTLLAGYSRTRRSEAALDLFEEMMAAGVEPDDVSLVAALSACAQLGAQGRGRAVHGYIEKRRRRVGGTAGGVFLATALVDMYAKCGRIEAAVNAFRRSPEKNLFTWNALIVGLGMHGHGELSLEYLHEMRLAGVRPDGVTFLGVLAGCSHAGLVDAARWLFDGMAAVQGVERELKHYGCMADILGRAGMIREAMDMIDGMPMVADAYVWGGVLAGCRIHGDVQAAEIAAARLLELNPEDSGIYSVLADIYANARRWEDVATVRKLMEERKVRKNVAHSAIQDQTFLGTSPFLLSQGP